MVAWTLLKKIRGNNRGKSVGDSAVGRGDASLCSDSGVKDVDKDFFTLLRATKF